MSNKLDIKKLKDGFKSIEVGVLTLDIINKMSLNRDKCKIILWEDRFKYIGKHKCDFENEESFEKHISMIPEIIKHPDYVGKHPSNDSIQYIKRLDELIIVAVRIKNQGNLAVRSTYILSEEQLADYIKKGTVYKM